MPELYTGRRRIYGSAAASPWRASNLEDTGAYEHYNRSAHDHKLEHDISNDADPYGNQNDYGSDHETYDAK